MQPLPFFVYRHFDKEGRLLYVGMSLSAVERLHQHMKDSPWAAEIATITVDRYDDKGEAQNAETTAIIMERPLWNDHHNRAVNKRHKRRSTVENQVPSLL